MEPSFSPPARFTDPFGRGRVFYCIDAHTCGNPVRLVVHGAPALRGQNMREKRQHFLREYDWIRRSLMFEPRGHDMMSGHGTIGTVTIAITERLITPRQPGVLSLETPAGTVRAAYEEQEGRVRSVRVTNVASFLAAEDLAVDCPGLGMLQVDVAYGGNFYAIVDPQEHFRGLEHHTAADLIAMSRILRQRINDAYTFVHPTDATISGVSHVMWTGAPLRADSTARNAVFYGDKAIDRSPCGTGTSARMAQWHARGRLKQGEVFVHESIIGSQFTGRIEREVNGIGGSGLSGVIPSIEGWARIYGFNTICVDGKDDPFALGFQVI